MLRQRQGRGLRRRLARAAGVGPSARRGWERTREAEAALYGIRDTKRHQRHVEHGAKRRWARAARRGGCQQRTTSAPADAVRTGTGGSGRGLLIPVLEGRMPPAEYGAWEYMRAFSGSGVPQPAEGYSTADAGPSSKRAAVEETIPSALSHSSSKNVTEITGGS